MKAIRLAVPLLVVLLQATHLKASEPPETVDLALGGLDARGVLTMLRTVVGARDLALVDEQTIRATAAPEVLELASAVVELAAHPSDAAGPVPLLETPDGTVIACLRLHHAAANEVGIALRTHVEIARLAWNNDDGTVMVRDTPARVEAALHLIRDLERPEN